MNNIIKFLLIPVIMVGINNSNCYSMENQNVIKKSTETNGVIKYSDNRPANENATFEQWTTRANFDPIDVDRGKYDNFHEFCEKHNLLPLREGIRGFLIDIYKLALRLISGDYFKLLTLSPIDNLKKISSIYTIKNLAKRWEECRGTKEENTMSLKEKDTNCQLIHINDMKSIIRTAQKKLNPDKYSKNNTMNQTKSFSKNIMDQDKYSDNDISDNISFDTNKSLNLVKCCYYLANQLVQLTHDIVYALNEKVKKYEETKMSNTEIYKDFKNYLIDKIIKPCYNALDQVFLLLKEDDLILLKSNEHNYSDTEDFLHELKHYCNIKNIRYNLIYNFSSLGTELSNKSMDFFDTFKNSIETIEKNMPEKISSAKINKYLFILKNLSRHKKTKYAYNRAFRHININGPSIIKDINDNEITTNNEIIDSANQILQGVRNNIGNILIYVNNDDNEIDDYLDYTLDEFNMRIPDNKDYLSEIKELLKRIG